jgi:hypothetical protein
MTTVTLSIASREAVTRRFLNAAAGHAEGHFISFATPSLLFGTLTAKRWDRLAARERLQPRSRPFRRRSPAILRTAR